MLDAVRGRTYRDVRHTFEKIRNIYLTVLVLDHDFVIPPEKPQLPKVINHGDKKSQGNCGGSVSPLDGSANAMTLGYKA